VKKVKVQLKLGLPSRQPAASPAFGGTGWGSREQRWPRLSPARCRDAPRTPLPWVLSGAGRTVEIHPALWAA